jgi:hypothetical protein
MVRSCPFVADPSSRMTGGRGDGTGSRAGRVWGSRKAVRGSGHGISQVQLLLAHFPNSPILNPTLWFPALQLAL